MGVIGLLVVMSLPRERERERERVKNSLQLGVAVFKR
jgi:hypothetical protein